MKSSIFSINDSSSLKLGMILLNVIPQLFYFYELFKFTFEFSEMFGSF